MSYIGQAMSIISFAVAYHGINKCPYLSKKTNNIIWYLHQIAKNPPKMD